MTRCDHHEWDWGQSPAVCLGCEGIYFGVALNPAKAGEELVVDTETPVAAAERILRLADERAR